MSSTSQNFPRTFYKLSTTWDAKTGTRTFKDSIWSIPSSAKNDPISMIPAMMTDKLGKMPDMMAAFEQVGLMERRNDQVWIYDMRQSDVLPKSTSDLERLYSFAQLAIRTWFNQSDADYLRKHSHISTCFIVWYFTKPNFFYKDKVMKQTTRYGIQRIWTPFFIAKQPKVVSSTPTPRADSTRSVMTTTDAMLPKQQVEQEKIRANIAKIFNDAGGKPFGWDDPLDVHRNISGAIANDDRLFSIKQTKKLQNLYNEYTKITSKIDETMRKRAKTEFVNSRIVNHTQSPGGEPALSPTSSGAAEETVESGVGDEPVEAVSPCLQDPEEEVVDSWEDL